MRCCILNHNFLDARKIIYSTYIIYLKNNLKLLILSSENFRN